MDKIEIQNLYKVFGPDPQKAISLLRQGHDKNAVLAPLIRTEMQDGSKRTLVFSAHDDEQFKEQRGVQ